jgi:adenine C2-methylase RlmN of 23S rRNA A2503 and tRNA A37
MNCDEIASFVTAYSKANRCAVLNYAATPANTTPSSARRLAMLFRALPHDVALRIFDINKVRGQSDVLNAPTDVRAFIAELRSHNRAVTVRYSRPVAQSAHLACGQMRADSLSTG